MLDDLRIIAKRDKSDLLGIAEKQIEQLATEFTVKIDGEKVENIVFAGLGGSAVYAEMAKTWPGVTVPFEVVRGYDVPSYVSNNTLFIAASYSGNTEETMSATEQAHSKGAQIVIISAGGALVEFAKAKKLGLISLNPDLPQPRLATFEGYKATVSILEAAGVCRNSLDVLDVAAMNLKNTTQDWRPDVPISKNTAKQLALELMGRSIVIYGGPYIAPMEYKWKISFNENAKNIAWANQYPELNHNEFIGWTSHPTDKPYALINLISPDEHQRVQKRFQVSDRLLSGRRPHPNTVEAEGESQIEQMLWLSMFGDFVSLYLAILNNVDPEPVELVGKLKDAMKQED